MAAQDAYGTRYGKAEPIACGLSCNLQKSPASNWFGLAVAGAAFAYKRLRAQLQLAEIATVKLLALSLANRCDGRLLRRPLAVRPGQLLAGDFCKLQLSPQAIGPA